MYRSYKRRLRVITTARREARKERAQLEKGEKEKEERKRRQLLPLRRRLASLISSPPLSIHAGGRFTRGSNICVQ
jgi:hypothetical protein